jgi:SAM-dependent methyltransferase
MKFVKIDPPGTWCTHQAIRELIIAFRAKGVPPRTFIEVGCGDGRLASVLCGLGMRGVGIDFSAAAIESTQKELAPWIDKGSYQVLLGDFAALPLPEKEFDLGVSIMVMEHIADDQAFLTRLISLVRPRGHLIIGVPARMDRWNVEDETVGHLRRYERPNLDKLLIGAGLEDVSIWSVGVPTANLLFHLGNFFIRRSGSELKKTDQPLREQTEQSGIREIPFKTVFPAWFQLLLNRITLFPLFLLQRRFYGTGLGLILIASGRTGGRGESADGKAAGTSTG